MRLADDNFTLKLGSRPFALRPSLRAAFDLCRKYEGYRGLARAIADGKFTACDDLLSLCCVEPAGWFVCRIKPNAVRDTLAARDQLLEFVAIMAGAKSKSDKPQTGKPISFEEYHTRLFKIGTGWLGWTPAETWSATPAEIVAAHEGRQDMLKALFGKRDEDQTADVADGSLSSARADLNAIGDLTVHSVSGSR